MTDWTIPFVSLLTRHPRGKYYVWYRGNKVGTFDFNYQYATNLSTWVYTMNTERTIGRSIGSVHLLDFVPDAQPEITDFTMGPEGDPRLLDFQLEWSPEQKAEGQRIFQEVFQGNWKRVGQWVYQTKFPATVQTVQDRWGRSRLEHKTSKTLKIKYDSEGESDDDEPHFQYDTFVFLADGKLFDISKFGGKRVYDIPVDLKLEDVQMRGLPLLAWLLMARPTEFVDTVTTCMAFKKMILDQCEVQFPRYYCRWLWLMTGDEMCRIWIYNTKVFLNGRYLSLEEVRALMDRKNDFWLGGQTLRKLFSDRPRPDSDATTP